MENVPDPFQSEISLHSKFKSGILPQSRINCPNQSKFQHTLQFLNFIIPTSTSDLIGNKEVRVYFWRKAGKALKTSRKTGKNTENLAGNREMPFWSHGKLKKISGKPEKAYFSCRKLETDPLFPALNKVSITWYVPCWKAASVI